MALATDVASLVEPLQRMALHLSHAQGSAVLLATTPDADLARALAEELQTRLTGHVVRQFHFAPDRLDLPAFLRTLPLPDPERRSVVFGFGLDDLPAADRKRAIDELNLGRETLRWTGHSVVLWLRPPTTQQITFQAPDFFAVRSGLFDFTAPTDGVAREETLRALNVNGAATLPDLRQRYLNYVVSTYRWLDFRGLMQVRNLVRLPLQDVFVPLQADISSSQSVSSKLRVSYVLGDFVVGEVNPTTSGWNYDAQDSVRITDYRLKEYRRESHQEERKVDLAEVLREKLHLAVLGDPGSGKSTLLKYLALAFAEGEAAVRERLKLDETRLPILVPIAAYSLFASRRTGKPLNGPPIADFLPEHFKSLGLPDLNQLFEHAFNAGEAIVLLDGLDEVVDAAMRSLVAREVEWLASAYPRCRFVVTSRVAGYSPVALGPGFATVTIRPFERAEIERFAQQWSRAYEALNVEEGRGDLHGRPLPPEAELRANARAKSLTEAIFANPAIERLATTPLLLTLLALIHHTGTRLPSRRVELYRLCVEALAETWNLARSQSGQPIELWLGERRLDEREAVRLLAPVAFHMHARQPGGLITRAELEALIAEQLREDYGDRAPVLAHQFVELVREQVGLMLERGPDLFGFMHLTFEEYLAARYLAAKRDPFSLIKPRLHAPRWREVILLTAASLEGERTTNFVRAILTANSPLNDVLHLDLFLAARCLADDVRVEVALRRDIVNRLVELALHGTYEKLRQEAAASLGVLRGTAAEQDTVPLLLAALRDEDWLVREHAVEALTRVGQSSEAVVGALVTALHDKKKFVRERAADALGRLGQTSDAVISALLAALKDESVSVRGSAMEALGGLGQASETVVSALLVALWDKDYHVHGSLVAALGRLGQASEAMVSVLLAALRDDEATVRERAAEALGQLGQPLETVVSALLAALRHDEATVRWRAAEALGQLGQPSEAVISALVDTLQDDSGAVRGRAAAALGQLGQASEAVVSALLAALRDDKEATVRWRAAAALGQLGRPSEALVSALLAAQRDDDETVRGSAAMALGQMGQASEVVVSALLAAQRDDDETVRGSAAMALGRLGQVSEAVVSALLAALQDEDWPVRWRAAAALGQLGYTSPEVIRALCGRLDKQHTYVRDAAYVALWQLVPKMYEEEVSTDAAADRFAKRM